MKGLPPRDYGLTWGDIAIVIAQAKKAGGNAEAEVRRQFLVSPEQAQEWVKQAYRDGVVPKKGST